MPRYRYTGDAPCLVPDAGVEVQPGDEFDSEVVIKSPVFEPVKDKPAKAPSNKEVK